MKLFGEYLVEKKIINEDALVHALVDQIRETPSMAEAALDTGLIQPQDLLRIFKAQHARSQGFVEAAKELGIWTDELGHRIGDKLAQKRPPLGQVLVKRGATTMEQITHALDEFLGESQTAAAAGAAAPAESASAASAAPTPAAEVAPGAAVDENSMFQDLLTADLREKMLGMIQPEQITSSLKPLKEIAHRLRGGARLAGFKNSENLLHGLELTLEDLSAKEAGKIKPETVTKVAKVLNDAVEALWRVPALDQPDSASEARKEAEKLSKDSETSMALLRFDIGLE